ncbi:MAG: DUF6290 family protein [Pseudomonadota bacterium]
MLALRLPKDIEDRLDALAKKTGRTKSFYAREAILEHLDDLEDLYYVLQRKEEGYETVSFEDAMSELGISDEDLDKIDAKERRSAKEEVESKA